VPQAGNARSAPAATTPATMLVLAFVLALDERECKQLPGGSA
jgi:hypothetical protein